MKPTASMMIVAVLAGCGPAGLAYLCLEEGLGFLPDLVCPV